MIVVRDLVKHYGDVRAVDGLSFLVRSGEVYGFLGANGAGKTTTLRILAGLARATAGTAEVGGFDVIAQPLAAKRCLGFVPDRPFLYDRLTAEETLRFVGRLHGIAGSDLAERIERELEAFELAALRHRPAGALSHGNRQKLALATALVHDPDVLIIDEPMVGLDALAQRRLRELLRELAGRGRAVLMTTHTLAVAEAICDRIGIVHRGRLAAEGTPAELVGSGGLEDVLLALNSAGPA